MPDSSEAQFLCDPRGPAVRLPAVGSRVHWEFMQLPGEKPDEHPVPQSPEGSIFLPTADFSAIKIWSYGHVG